MLTSLSQQPSQESSCHHSTLGAMMMMRSPPRKGIVIVETCVHSSLRPQYSACGGDLLSMGDCPFSN